jgi:ABC-type sugar transport system substrate-binding protein
MHRLTTRAMVAVFAIVALAVPACSSSGGKQEQKAATDIGPHRTIAMITHAEAGDTFWDIIRKGAETAAAKDNTTLVYSSDPEAGRQVQLVQQAIDQHVDGIALTLSNPAAMKDAVAKAKAAGIPVISFNAGEKQSAQLGALAHIGQDETNAGNTVGRKLNDLGAKHVACVIQQQGQVQLEDRCAGVKQTFSGNTEVLYVNGKDMSEVKSSITAKLQADRSIDTVLALGAPIAMTGLQSVGDAGSSAKVASFDMNKTALQAVRDGKIQFTVDQQPFLQGYEAVDQLWLYKKNGNVMGVGQQSLLTGPNLVTKENAAAITPFADQGTR